ncbi:MAG TPA: hypothetical protein VMV79_02280, partial [Alphaproteobacteria bacterium]|nr:hypothetical protein [Alphaproteobacteria bacterium]
VRDISLTNRSLPQVSPPIAGGPFQPTLAEAVQHWVDGRLRATGASGQAIVIIRDIELTSRPIPTAEGMSSWFKRQQGSRYLGRIAVEIDAHGSPGFAIASAEAHRAVSLPENPTEDEEQEAYDQLLEGLMADLNRNLERSIDRHMQDFLVNAPALPQAAPAPSMMPSAP